MSASASNPSPSSSPVGGASAGGSSSGGGSNTGPCGACKFLRRKCHVGCVFAPYFDADQGSTYFAAVHKVFGASNVSKLLQQIPIQRRLDAVVTICYEAQARLKDPVYGIVAQIFGLQQQVINLQTELTYLQGHLTQLQLSPPVPPPPLQPPLMVVPPPLNISDLPSPSSVPTNYDLSSLFDTMGSSQSSAWAMQAPYQANSDPRLYGRGGGGSSPLCAPGGGDLQAIAQEFMNYQCSSHHSHSTSVGRTEASPPSSSSPLSG